MAKFVLPFTEVQVGWFEIEAETIEAARAVVVDGGFVEDHEMFFKSGYVAFDEKELFQEEVV